MNQTSANQINIQTRSSG